MEFLANENFPLVGFRLLRKAGHSVKSVIEDSPGSKDRDVISCAKNENRIILTFDRDYGRLIYHSELLPAEGKMTLGRSSRCETLAPCLPHVGRIDDPRTIPYAGCKPLRRSVLR